MKSNKKSVGKDVDFAVHSPTMKPSPKNIKGARTTHTKANLRALIQIVGDKIYTSPDSAVRELFVNALSHGIMQRIQLDTDKPVKEYLETFDPLDPKFPRVEITLDPVHRKLTIHDVNGMGMPMKLCEEVVESLNVSGNIDGLRAGQWGMGVYSFLKLSSMLTINTHSSETGEKFQKISRDGVQWDTPTNWASKEHAEAEGQKCDSECGCMFVQPDMRSLITPDSEPTTGTKLELSLKPSINMMDIINAVKDVGRFWPITTRFNMSSDWVKKSKESDSVASYGRGNDTRGPDEIVYEQGVEQIGNYEVKQDLLDCIMHEDYKKRMEENKDFKPLDRSYRSYAEIITNDFELVMFSMKSPGGHSEGRHQRHNSKYGRMFLVNVPIEIPDVITSIIPECDSFYLNILNERKFSPTADRDRLETVSAQLLSHRILEGVRDWYGSMSQDMLKMEQEGKTLHQIIHADNNWVWLVNNPSDDRVLIKIGKDDDGKDIVESVESKHEPASELYQWEDNLRQMQSLLSCYVKGFVRTQVDERRGTDWINPKQMQAWNFLLAPNCFLQSSRHRANMSCVEEHLGIDYSLYEEWNKQPKNYYSNREVQWKRVPEFYKAGGISYITIPQAGATILTNAGIEYMSGPKGYIKRNKLRAKPLNSEYQPARERIDGERDIKYLKMSSYGEPVAVSRAVSYDKEGKSYSQFVDDFNNNNTIIFDCKTDDVRQLMTKIFKTSELVYFKKTKDIVEALPNASSFSDKVEKLGEKEVRCIVQEFGSDERTLENIKIKDLDLGYVWANPGGIGEYVPAEYSRGRSWETDKQNHQYLILFEDDDNKEKWKVGEIPIVDHCVKYTVTDLPRNVVPPLDSKNMRTSGHDNFYYKSAEEKEDIEKLYNHINGALERVEIKSIVPWVSKDDADAIVEYVMINREILGHNGAGDSSFGDFNYFRIWVNSSTEDLELVYDLATDLDDTRNSKNMSYNHHLHENLQTIVDLDSNYGLKVPQYMKDAIGTSNLGETIKELSSYEYARMIDTIDNEIKRVASSELGNAVRIIQQSCEGIDVNPLTGFNVRTSVKESLGEYLAADRLSDGTMQYDRKSIIDKLCKKLRPLPMGHTVDDQDSIRRGINRFKADTMKAEHIEEYINDEIMIDGFTVSEVKSKKIEAHNGSLYYSVEFKLTHEFLHNMQFGIGDSNRHLYCVSEDRSVFNNISVESIRIVDSAIVINTILDNVNE